MAASLVHAQTAPVQNIAGLRLLSPSQSVSPGILALDPSISADGKRIAFWSNAPDLVSGDNNNVSDVFLSDLWSFHKALSRRLQHTWLAPVIQTTLPAKAPGGAGPFHQSLRSTSAL